MAKKSASLTSKKRALRLLSVLPLVCAIAACGGGGSRSDVSLPPKQDTTPGSGAPSDTNTQPIALSPQSNVALQVLPATYPAGSIEKGAWDYLQKHRGMCGFGLLTQNTRLDAANVAHTNYLEQETRTTGSLYLSHEESILKPLFTGTYPWERAWYQGLPSDLGVSEIISGYYTNGAPFQNSEANGRMAMASLFNTVYHLSGALTSGFAGGVGSKTFSGNNASYFLFGALVSVEQNDQRFGNGVVATFPCEGVTEVSATFDPATEVPNPFVSYAGKKMGTPIYVKVDEGQVLNVTSWKIRNVTAGIDLSAEVLIKSNDPAGYVRNNETFVVPSEPLIKGNTYSVTIQGDVDSTAFTKTFNFKPTL